MTLVAFRPLRLPVRAVAATLVALVALASAAFAEDSAVTEARIDALVGRMSLAEKIGQLNLVSNNPSLKDSDIASGGVGGVMGYTTADSVARVQQAARRSRLGIPLLVGLDVVHGLRTMFPMPLAEAASFDPQLAHDAAEMAAREASAIGINWTFGPVADVARDPRWGRIVEGAGEDPLMARRFTAARVEGFHAGGLGTALKHFAGYGGSIGGRDYDAVDVSTSSLFDTYLPPFEAGIQAGSESVMAAFVAINGVPATANPWLLTDILRRRLGFTGFVVSDWYGIPELLDHGVAADEAEAARKALLAGTDMDMASGVYARYLAAEVATGRVPEAAVDDAVRRVLRTKIRMGLFERAPAADPPPGPPPPPSPEARALARRAAQDTIVLLRNQGALPLAAPHRIAVIGGMASSGEALAGPHAALVHFEDGVTLLDGIRRRSSAAGGEVVYAPGCDAFCRDTAGFAEAAATAATADVIVAVLGEPIDWTGESASRAHLTLPGNQAELLDQLVATGKPVVLVLIASRPVEFGPVLDRLAAVMMAWYPGTEGGNAVADLLFGDVSPSAKLPISWPRTVGQAPLPYDRLPSGRPADPQNRFTLRYADEALTPRFPFGFGLSYTRFTLSDLTIADRKLRPDGTLSVSVRVTNTGERAGREVVQLYARRPVASRSRPLRQLVGFQKVALGPGESRAVTIAVPARELGFHDDTGALVLEPGRFELFAGTDANAQLRAGFELVAR